MQRTKAKTINKDKILCLTLLTLVVALVGCYMYFVSAAVVNVVIRKEVNQDLVAMHTDISQLETDYIDAQHRVSDEIARLEGYETVTSKVFIDRAGDSLVMSSNR